MPRVADYRTILDGTITLGSGGAGVALRKLKFEMPEGFDQQSKSYLVWRMVTQTGDTTNIDIFINPSWHENDPGVPESHIFSSRWSNGKGERSSIHTFIPGGRLFPHGGEANNLELYLNAQIFGAGANGPVEVHIRDMFILCQVNI